MGNYTNAYATITSGDNKMANFANDQEEINFRRRQEQRQNRKDKEEEKKLNDEKLKELAKYKSKLTPYDTGSATLNTTIANALVEAKDKIFEQYKIANDRNKSDNERMQAWANIEDLNNYPEHLKNITDRLSEVNQNYAESLSKGNVFRNEEYEKKWQNGFSGLTVKMNDQFRPDVVFIDKNNDGINDLEAIDVMKFDQITKLIPSDIMMNKIDLESLAYKIGKDLGTTTTKDSNGYWVNEKVEVTDNTARAAVKQLISDDSIRSYLRINGLDYKQEITPKLEKQVEDELVKIALSNTNREDKNTFNYADENADLTRDMQKKNADRNYKLNKDKWDYVKNKDKKGGKSPFISGATTPSSNTWGSDFIKDIDTNSTKAVNISNGGVKINSLPVAYNEGNSKKTKTISDASVENYTYTKDGKLLIDISYESSSKKGDTPSKKLKERVIASNETELKLANELGLSIEELRKTAKNDTRQKIDY